MCLWVVCMCVVCVVCVLYVYAFVVVVLCFVNTKHSSWLQVVVFVSGRARTPPQ